jgi:serine/threonine protein kinase
LLWRLTDSSGGQAEAVFLCHLDGRPDDLVVVKQFPEHLDGDQRVRLGREWEVARSIGTPNVVRARELIDGPPVAVVQEYVDGTPLDSFIAQNPQGVCIKRVCEIGEWVLRGLVDLHQFKGGTPHRDIKPANVILTDDHAVIIDLGLAKPKLGLAPAKETLVMASLAYASPEQLLGEELTPATDIFSMGVVLFELWAGWNPIVGRAEGRSVLESFLEWQGKAELDGMAVEFAGLLVKTLNREPGARPEASALNWDLRRLMSEGTPYVSRPGTPRTRTAVLPEPGSTPRGDTTALPAPAEEIGGEPLKPEPLKSDSLPLKPHPRDRSTRRAMVVLVDASPSMGLVRQGRPTAIAEVNRVLRATFDQGDLAKGQFGDNGEVAVGVFGTSAGATRIDWLDLAGGDNGIAVGPGSPLHFAQDARWEGTVSRFEDDGTPLGAAILAALKVVDDRREELRDEGVTWDARPVVVLLTDGKPTDSTAEATRAVHEREDSGALAFWIVGTGGARRHDLAGLADKGNFVDLGTKPLGSFARFMAVSAQSVDGHQPAVDLYRRITDKWRDLEEG